MVIVSDEIGPFGEARGAPNAVPKKARISRRRFRFIAAGISLGLKSSGNDLQLSLSPPEVIACIQALER
jgi:hypothetical protein